MPTTRVKSLLLAACVAVTSSAAAAPAAPVAANIDPLTLYVRTTWPEHIQTVGDAASYVLEPSGYSVAVGATAPSGVTSILNAPMPAIARVNRTMPVIDVLQMLIGPDAWIVVDPANRLVSFSESAP